MRPRVYLAGPLSNGDRKANVDEALRVGRQLIDEGFAPLIPHLLEYVYASEEQEWETWLAIDEVWLQHAEALLRMEGNSPGADREEEFCRIRNIPVVYSIEELKALFAGRV